MSELSIMNAHTELMDESAARIPLTVVRRLNGRWALLEVADLRNNLSPSTEVFTNHDRPHYVVLYGRYQYDDIRKATHNRVQFVAEEVIGLRNKKLPFQLDI